MCSKLAESCMKQKHQFDLDRGIEEEMVLDDPMALLISRDTKLFTKLFHTVQTLIADLRRQQNHTEDNNPPGSSRSSLHAIQNDYDPISISTGYNKTKHILTSTSNDMEVTLQ